MMLKRSGAGPSPTRATRNLNPVGAAKAYWSTSSAWVPLQNAIAALAPQVTRIVASPTGSAHSQNASHGSWMPVCAPFFPS